jgi:hypothetical protein
MSEQIDNLSLWNKVEKTNPAHIKDAKIGQLSIKAINAQSQIKEATKQFGTYGNTWGLKNLKYSFMDIETTKMAMLGAEFYYPSGEFEIHTTLKIAYMTQGANGYLKIDDDFMKKMETDVTTKALSKLGFNADVFMGLYDDNRYVNQMKEEFNPVPKAQPKVIEKINETQAKELNSLFTSDEHKNDFLATCKISKIEDLPLSWYDKAIEKLSK